MDKKQTPYDPAFGLPMLRDASVYLGQLMRQNGDSLLYTQGPWRFLLQLQERITPSKSDSSVVVLDGTLAAPPFLPIDLLPYNHFFEFFGISGNLW